MNTVLEQIKRVNTYILNTTRLENNFKHNSGLYPVYEHDFKDLL